MTDQTYSKQFWRFADAQEDSLMRYIESLDIADRTAQVFHRFRPDELDELMTPTAVSRLHRETESWIQNGLDERSWRLLVRDIQNRRQIRNREALAIWLLAAFSVYYQDIYLQTGQMIEGIAENTYRIAFEDAHAITGTGRCVPPGQKNINEWMKDVTPSFGRTFINMLWIEALYNRDTLLARYQTEGEDGAHFNPDSLENQRKFKNIEKRLLARSKPTASEPQGHHGIIDKQMTSITGRSVMKAMKDAKISRYRFIAVIDSVTTDACRALNGQIFSITEAKFGVNVPPISIDGSGNQIPHPCRSIIRALPDAAAYIRSSGTGEQESAHTYKQIGKIDLNDRTAVKSLLDAFAKTYSKSKRELCLVIAENGDVFMVYGDQYTVNTDLLGIRMKGSINIHNHPPKTTQYSFSQQDIESFYTDGSAVMMACDERYIYEIRRPEKMPKRDELDAAIWDAKNKVWETLDSMGIKDNIWLYREHAIIAEACKSLGIKYQRWKNEY